LQVVGLYQTVFCKL